MMRVVVVMVMMWLCACDESQKTPDSAHTTGGNTLCEGLAAGAICRPSQGPCDFAEVCDGGPACPGDMMVPAGIVCRSAAGSCDTEETCDGTSVACPTDAFKPTTVVCRAAAGPCDLADSCTGTSADCADAVRPSTFQCRAKGVGLCDSEDLCNGVTKECDDIFLSGNSCRASQGACDVEDICTGAGPNCGLDVLLPANVFCRRANGSTGVCDGTSNACI
jgi:hypothetical protein